MRPSTTVGCIDALNGRIYDASIAASIARALRPREIDWRLFTTLIRSTRFTSATLNAICAGWSIIPIFHATLVIHSSYPALLSLADHRRDTELDRKTRASMLKAVYFTIFVTVAFLTGVPQLVRAGQLHQDAAGEQAVRQIIQRFGSAWNRADPEAVTAVFSSDGELVSPSGSVTSDRAEIRKLLVSEFQDTLKGTTLTTTVTAIRFVKEDAALAKGKFTLQDVDVFFGWEMTVSGSFIFRIRRTDGQWLIEKAYILRN